MKVGELWPRNCLQRRYENKNRIERNSRPKSDGRSGTRHLPLKRNFGKLITEKNIRDEYQTTSHWLSIMKCFEGLLLAF